MTVWEKIKKELTKNARCGSAGYQAELTRAASVFVAILPHLSDQKTEEDLFNADREVTEALVNRKHLIEIGVLKG